MVAAMIGGGCGGLYAGLTHTHRFATGSSGLPAILLYIGDNSMECFYNILIALAITIVVTAVVTYVLSFKFEKASSQNEEGELEKTELKEIPLEKGCGIEPQEGTVYAPFNGKIILVANTKHAIGIASDDGIEMMIHVGIDTVELDGEGFQTFVNVGDTVTCGQKLMNFDKEKIAEKYRTVTAVLITNSDNYQNIELVKEGITEKLEKIMTAI